MAAKPELVVASAAKPSDASSLAGLPPGRYETWDQEFDVLPEGKIVVPGSQFLAGSWAFTDQCVNHVLNLCDLTMTEAVDMATARPRALLGLPARRLEPGNPADLVLFDWTPGQDWRLRATISAGQLIRP